MKSFFRNDVHLLTKCHLNKTKEKGLEQTWVRRLTEGHTLEPFILLS